MSFFPSFDNNDNVFDYIYAYHQEEVFSLIINYGKNIFDVQNKEDQTYYLNIASKMKSLGKEIFFLEYTKDKSLFNKIKSYCDSKQYHYYIASNVDLN